MDVIDQTFDPAIPIDAIQEHKDNPRKGDDRAVGESIARNGFFGAVLVQRSTGNVIAGNTRYRVMSEEGHATIPGFWVDCDDETATRIMLADNRTSDLAFYDDEQLFALLRGLVESEGLDGTGYDRAAYELLLQSVEADSIVGGIRQGVIPEERIDAYNELDIRSLILPYEFSRYEPVAQGLATLRNIWEMETNADVVERLVREALEDVGAPVLALVSDEDWVQRGQTGIPRLTLERGPALVPCAYAADKEERWRGRIASCGERVPYNPRHLCPSCGNRLVKSHAPDPGPNSRVIDGNVAIIDAETDQVVAVHIVCATDLASDLAASLSQVKWDDQVFANVTTTSRLNGMAVTHRTFGYQPPVPMRRRYGCSRSVFNSEYPEAMAQIAQFCKVAEHVFRTHASDVHDVTCARVRDNIAPAWLIAGTPWSSGIINKTVSLPYHRDQANISTSWSAMLVCRRQVDGGMLHLADYDTYFTVPHGSITIFDGQSVVHGVTGLRMLSPAGFRYSLVTYAKTGMRVCCSDPAKEAHRAALHATRQEDLRAAGFKVGKKVQRFA